MNSVFSFNKYNFFSFLAAGFCPKNLAFARKIMALQPLSPLPWLVYAYVQGVRA